MLSETSANKNNSLNPGCGESFSKLHSIIFCMKRLGTSMKVCVSFHNVNGRKKVLTLYFIQYRLAGIMLTVKWCAVYQISMTLIWPLGCIGTVCCGDSMYEIIL